MSAKVGLVDDHPAVMLGLSVMLKSDPRFHIAGAAGTVEALLRYRSSFDIVLLDLRLDDGTSPTENVHALQRAGAIVLAYTAGDDPVLIREVARAGVAGLVRKSELPDRVVDALVHALSGETIATPEWASALMEDRGFVDAQLTAREAQVLRSYASGLTAESVAVRLSVSADTVQDHLRRIRRRYARVGRDAPTKLDLHRRAVEDGLIPPDR